MVQQGELFDADVPQVRKRTAPPSTKVTYSGYSQSGARRPHHCDHCILNTHDDWMKGIRSGPLPRRAKYRRQSPDGSVLYLCHQHANDQRAVDGIRQVR
jgi:hypothetical protein